MNGSIWHKQNPTSDPLPTRGELTDYYEFSKFFRTLGKEK
jgi:hypothetical protein